MQVNANQVCLTRNKAFPNPLCDMYSDMFVRQTCCINGGPICEQGMEGKIGCWVVEEGKGGSPGMWEVSKGAYMMWHCGYEVEEGWGRCG